MSSLTEPEAVERNILIASTTLTGLMVLQYVWNMRFEMRFIWPQFRKSTEAKIFVITRYVGMAGQIFNVFFSIRVAAGIPSHPLTCLAWFSYQGVAIEILLISVEILLMLLVRKMYNNDTFSLVALIFFLGAQFAAVVFSTRTVLPELDSSPMCIIASSHPNQVYTGTSAATINLCILILMLWRYFRGDWSDPLRLYLKVAVRDSIGAIIVVTAMFLFVAFMPHVEFNQSQTIINVTFHVILLFLWFIADRLVLGREKLRQQSLNDNDLMLTQVDFDALEPPWTL